MDADGLAQQLTLTPDGLIPAIVQQHDTGEVLMFAWMTPATLAETLALGETVFWSRSRSQRWHKGATSGNTQQVIDIAVDCDADVLLVRVEQGEGVACHTGHRSCFHRPVTGDRGVLAADDGRPRHLADDDAPTTDPAATT